METEATSIAFFKKKIENNNDSCSYYGKKEEEEEEESYNVSFFRGSDFKFLNGPLSLSDSSFEGCDKPRLSCTERVRYFTAG